MEQNNNKKTLVLSLVAVLVLVGSVIGVAYAMFSFSATGTQTNVIKTGYVTMNYENESVINLQNALPTADSAVVESDANTLKFDVVASIQGTMTVNYDLAIDSATIVEGTTLTADKVKIKLSKSTDSGASYTAVDLGSNNTIASRKSIAGTYASSTNASQGTGVTSYALDSGQFTADGKVSYKLTAWIDEDFELVSGEGALTTDTSVAGQVTQSKGNSAETFKFKVKVVAGQANQ